MVSKIIIPSLGATGGDVVIEQWLVKPGDRIEAGAAIVTVSTDKANVDIEAFRGGYVREILVGDGTAAAVGAAIALVADSMEEALTEEADRNVRPTKEERQTGMSAPQAVADKDLARAIPASPLARRIAREHNIELASVKGSGRRGQIHRDDVMKMVSPAKTGDNGKQSPIGRLSPMRKAIAQRTRQSKSEIPHFYVTAKIDMTAGRALREQSVALAESNGGAKPSITDLAIAAAARALRRVPQMNVSYRDDTIATFDDVNVGVVIALDEGMMIPVIRSADRKDLFEIAHATRGLKDKAVAGTLSANDLSGGTFTISNLGMFGVENFIAVINPPEAAILALGAIRNELALQNGNVIERPILTVTLSADHRAVDGVTAAKFLGAFKDVLEKPLELVARRNEN